MTIEELQNEFENHRHTGIDSPQVDSKDLKGFPIYATAPTHDAPEGTIVLYYAAGVWRLYIRANKTWKYRTFNDT